MLGLLFDSANFSKESYSLKLEGNKFKQLPRMFYKENLTAMNMSLVELGTLRTKVNLSATEYSLAEANLNSIGLKVTEYARYSRQSDDIETESPSPTATEQLSQEPTPNPSQTSKAEEQVGATGNGSDSSLGAVIGIIVGGLALVAVIALLLYKRPEKEPKEPSNGSYIPPTPVPVRTVPAAELSKLRSLAGTPYYTAMYGGRQVIIKGSKDKKEEVQKVENKVLQQEGDRIGNVSNDHILEFIGTCKHDQFGYGLVAEFMRQGTLQANILDANVELSLAQRLQMCSALAEALAYLHDRQLHVHPFRDGDVLVDESMSCKVNIFKCHTASSTTLYSSNQAIGTDLVSFSAPELLVQNPRKLLSAEACNVYTLGVLMAEILTGTRPFDYHAQRMGRTSTELDILSALGQGTILKPFGDQVYMNHNLGSLAPQLGDLVENCLAADPKKRWTAKMVAQELNRLQTAQDDQAIAAL